MRQLLDIAPKEVRGPLGPLALILLYLVAFCVSLMLVAQRYAEFHFYFDERLIENAVVGLVFVGTVAPLVAFAEFTFGWIAGLYLYVTVAGFIWLSFFSTLHYDHSAARISAATSIVAFLLPALLITKPFKQGLSFSKLWHDRILLLIFIVATLTMVACATYGFEIVGIQDIEVKRAGLNYPTSLNYLINISISALLPYAFACYFAQGRYGRAVLAAGILLAFYPVTFTKTALVAPFWIIFLAVLTHWFEARISALLSLLLPTLVGLIAFNIDTSNLIFGTINFRMFAVPSSAMDHYNQFFSAQPLTYFCQIGLLRDWVSCPYSQQLSGVMADAFHLGNYNASLFATEGIASVGLNYAPISAFLCGIAIAMGNRCSASLPANFILLSSSLLALALLNTPLSTTLVTHGGLILFFLWYMTPTKAASMRKKENDSTLQAGH